MEKTRIRRLAAIMFADIVGYTKLMQNDEAEAVRVRKSIARFLMSSTNILMEK